MVRHAETELLPGVCIGQSDIVLSESGHRSLTTESDSMKSLMAELMSCGVEPSCVVVFSSDLQRSRLTAAAIASSMRVDLRIDGRLRELDFGEWERMPWSDIAMTHSELYDRWSRDWVSERPPNGESVCDLSVRVAAVLSELLHNSCIDDDCPAVLVTHAGWIRTALCMARGINFNSMFDLQVSHLGVYRLHS